MENLELDIMTIISSAGDSKAKAFEALKKVKAGDFVAAEQLLAESRKSDLDAHHVQTRLIANECDPNKDNLTMSLLMAHAQDHYMTSQLARELAEVLIDVFKSQGGK